MASYWNYRVIRTSYKVATNEETYGYQIHEIYYRDGNIVSWSASPMDPYGESVEELRDVLNKMIEALSKPVLEQQENTLVEISNEVLKKDADRLSLELGDIYDSGGC